MAVEFIKQLHRDSLEKAWNARPAKDPMPKRRQNVLDHIDGALAQLKNGETNPPRGSYQTRDNFNGVRVQLKFGQRALKIDGRDHWFVEDAASFFSAARKAVERGELDRAINDVLEGKEKGGGKQKAKSKVARPAPQGKPLDLKRVYQRTMSRNGEASADEPPAPKPGRYSQKYEKLLAAGTFSEPAV